MPRLPRLHTEAEDRRYFAGVIRGCDVLVVRREETPPGWPRLWTFQRNDGARAIYARHGFAEVEPGSASGTLIIFFLRERTVC